MRVPLPREDVTFNFPPNRADAFVHSRQPKGLTSGIGPNGNPDTVIVNHQPYVIPVARHLYVNGSGVGVLGYVVQCLLHHR